MFRQGLCRGAGCGRRPPRLRRGKRAPPVSAAPGAAGPAALLGKPAAPAGPPAAPAPRRSSDRPAAFTGRRHPPAPRSPLQSPGFGRSPPPSGRQTAPAGPFRRCEAPPGLRPACPLTGLRKAARPRFLPKTGPHCVVIPYPGCRRCRAAGYPPGTPARRRRRWRCGSSYRRSPAAVPQPRCRRRR